VKRKLSLIDESIKIVKAGMESVKYVENNVHNMVMNTGKIVIICC